MTRLPQRQYPDSPKRSRFWLPGSVLGAFLLALVLSGVFVLAVEKVRRNDAEIQVRQVASAAAHDLGSQLNRTLSASYALAALVRQGKGRVENFEALAGEMLRVYGGISALQLAPGGTIAKVVPLAGNEAVIGFSPLTDPRQGAEARRVIEQRRLGLTGPFELRQGGQGVVGRNPIFIEDANGQERFWGFVQVLIRLPDLLAETRLDTLVESGYSYELWRIRPEDGQRHVFVRSHKVPLDSPVTETVAVPDGQWSVSVAPVQGWVSPFNLSLELVAALCFSGLVALAVYLLARQPLLLQDEVARRTVELRESETRYRLMFEHSPVPMLVYDKATLRFLDANEAFVRSYGYTHDELLKMDILQIHPEEDRERLRAFVSPARAAGLRPAGDWRHCRRNGEVIDVEVTAHDIDFQGRDARLVLVMDVSERKRSDAHMRRQNRWMKTILEHFPDGISVADGNMRVVESNARFRELLDFPPELFEGPPRHLIDFVRYNAERGEYGDVDVDAYVAEASKRINLHVPHRFERTRPNGVVLEVRGSPLPDGGFVTSFSDVTERKAAEEKLRSANQRYEQLNAELEQRVNERTRLLAAEIDERRAAEDTARQTLAWLREIIDTLSSGIVLWNRDHKLTAWNRAFEQMFPQVATLLKIGLDRDLFRQQIEVDGLLQLHSRESGDWEQLGRWDRVLPDGRIILIERLATSDGGRLVLHTDVTHERHSQDVLARNERMASLGNLVAGIAHEINTPIGNALMVASSIGHRIEEFEAAQAAGALRRSVLDSFVATVRESGDLLERNLHRAAHLIQNFKQVAVDQTSDQRRVFDLATVLEEVRMTLTPKLKHSTHHFDLDVEVGVRMDSYPGALGQVVTNLVENALSHAFEGRQGGQLTLRARRLEGDFVELLFSDNGSGIPAEVLPRIFDPFFTTRMGRGGSGLGLSIVLNLVRDLLGGEITVQSQEGSGTCFRLALPCVAPAPGSVAPVSLP